MKTYVIQTYLKNQLEQGDMGFSEKWSIRDNKHHCVFTVVHTKAWDTHRIVYYRKLENAKME